MLKTIRILLEYNTYCLWLYDEKGEIIDNDNPPEWADDEKLSELFNAVSDIYDTFFEDTEKEFSFHGCSDLDTKRRFIQAIKDAVDYLEKKNNGKYHIQNDIDLNNL